MKRMLLRGLALVLSTTIGFASLTAAVAAVELTPNTDQHPQVETDSNSLSKLDRSASTDDSNQMAATVANLIAQMQAEEAARKAAEEEAARVAAEQAAAAQAAVAEEKAAQVVAAEEGDAWSILASYGLSGVSLSFGETYGYEAIAYYKSGHIVINPNHTTSLSTLIAHEVDHIIAYRQSGQTTE